WRLRSHPFPYTTLFRADGAEQRRYGGSKRRKGGFLRRLGPGHHRREGCRHGGTLGRGREARRGRRVDRRCRQRVDDGDDAWRARSEEHTSELQTREKLV